MSESIDTNAAKFHNSEKNQGRRDIILIRNLLNKPITPFFYKSIHKDTRALHFFEELEILS